MVNSKTVFWTVRWWSVSIAVPRIVGMRQTHMHSVEPLLFWPSFGVLWFARSEQINEAH